MFPPPKMGFAYLYSARRHGEAGITTTDLTAKKPKKEKKQGRRSVPGISCKCNPKVGQHKMCTKLNCTCPCHKYDNVLLHRV